jgi:hypothetical protein
VVTWCAVDKQQKQKELYVTNLFFRFIYQYNAKLYIRTRLGLVIGERACVDAADGGEQAKAGSVTSGWV